MKRKKQEEEAFDEATYGPLIYFSTYTGMEERIKKRSTNGGGRHGCGNREKDHSNRLQRKFNLLRTKGRSQTGLI